MGPGLAIQRLMEKGYGFGAEGDWKVAAMVRLPRSISDVAIPCPSLDVNTSLAGSSLSPIERGWHLI